jgi:hypothetical protein
MEMDNPELVLAISAAVGKGAVSPAGESVMETAAAVVLAAMMADSTGTANDSLSRIAVTRRQASPEPVLGVLRMASVMLVSQDSEQGLMGLVWQVTMATT